MQGSYHSPVPVNEMYTMKKKKKKKRKQNHNRLLVCFVHQEVLAADTNDEIPGKLPNLCDTVSHKYKILV